MVSLRSARHTDANREAPAAQVVCHLLPAMFETAERAARTWRMSGSRRSLHDLRVAARRYRAALRFFKSLLDAKQTRRVLKALDRLATVSGPVRDTDVLAGMGHGVRRAGGACAREREALRRFLAGRGFRDIQVQASRLHATGLIPRPVAGTQTIGEFVESRMRKRIEDLLCCDAEGHLDKPNRVHVLRKRTRRLRYWAEMAAPFCGGAMAAMAKRLHKAATVFGELHDVDVAIGRLGSPSSALRRMRRRRARSARSAWRALTRRRRRHRVLNAMSSLAKDEP